MHPHVGDRIAITCGRDPYCSNSGARGMRDSHKTSPNRYYSSETLYPKIRAWLADSLLDIAIPIRPILSGPSQLGHEGESLPVISSIDSFGNRPGGATHAPRRAAFQESWADSLGGLLRTLAAWRAAQYIVPLPVPCAILISPSNRSICCCVGDSCLPMVRRAENFPRAGAAAPAHEPGVGYGTAD